MSEEFEIKYTLEFVILGLLVLLAFVIYAAFFEQPTVFHNVDSLCGFDAEKDELFTQCQDVHRIPITNLSVEDFGGKR